MPAPLTPDARYILVRGRLWRAANPHLPDSDRTAHVHALMAARRAVRDPGDDDARAAARREVDAAKHALGERGPPWWTDGAPDYNRHLARNTPYAAWAATLDPCSAELARRRLPGAACSASPARRPCAVLHAQAVQTPSKLGATGWVNHTRAARPRDAPMGQSARRPPVPFRFRLPPRP